ncbi:MAG: PAC2 family protein [Desulfomonile tiedjei]|nr:PAC2 family protein [Desulfomonile tiedjei]
MTESVPRSYIEWDHVPNLRTPVLVAGFHGWSDAGGVSTDTIQYLVEVLQPVEIAALSNEPFVNYTLDRPVAQIEDGIIHELEPMSSQLYCWKNPSGNRDVALLLGKEPHHGWLTYSSVIIDIIRKLSVQQLYTVGGVQDTISHSAPAVVTVVGSSTSVVESALKSDAQVRAADYYGPISIHSCLVKACMDAGIDALSLWGHVPAYLQKNPRVVNKLVSILSKGVGMECPVDILVQKSIELDRKINEALAKDPNLKDLVERIEEREDFRSPASADDKVIRLNDFLRRDPHKDPGQ